MLFCKQAGAMVIDTTTIVAGTSKITGKIILPNNISKDSVFVMVAVPHPISGELFKYKALVDKIGKFSIDVDVETTITPMACLYISLDPSKCLFIKLTSNGVTNLDIAYDAAIKIKNIDAIPAINQYDMTKGFDVVIKMILYNVGRKRELLHNKSTDYFLNFVKIRLSDKLEILNRDSLLSNELKKTLSKDFPLYMYNDLVFDYNEEMIKNYRIITRDNSKKPDIQKIDKSYFHFLKDFNLNDPIYLNCSSFLEFQDLILHNEILNIPKIEDKDIPSWLASVKGILSDLVGFDKGPYYDILVANAYSRQLNEELRPLSKKKIS